MSRRNFKGGMSQNPSVPLIVPNTQEKVEEKEIVKTQPEKVEEKLVSTQEVTKQEKAPPEEKGYLTYETGSIKQVFRKEKDGNLTLIKSIPLTRDGQPAKRKFRLKPIPVSFRGFMKSRTYTLSPKEGISYHFKQKNCEWDKERKPELETIVAVDDDTARRLETMNQDFEEVFDRQEVKNG